MKPALSAKRALSVLNHLSVHQQSVFSLTELSAALDVSPASMSAVLLAMCEAGYLERHPRHRTYSLGPAAVVLGHAASARHPVVEASRSELRRLAALGSECIGSAAVGDDIMILAIEGRPSGRSRGSWVGQRIPMVPPFGQMFVAWRTSAQIDHWLRALGSERVRSEAALLESMRVSRQRGFFVGLRNQPVQAVVDAVYESAAHPDPVAHNRLQGMIPDQIVGYSLDRIDDESLYDVANLVVPVFGPDAEVIYALTLYGLEGISGGRLVEVAREMLDSAAVIERKIGGRRPDDATGTDPDR